MDLNNQQVERYARHLILDQISDEGQQKLLTAKILVVGCGGIGCPALLYLASAGIGELHIVDDDMVDLSNLQRQVLFTTGDIGKAKVVAAQNQLNKLNPEIKIIAHQQRVEPRNANELFEGMSLVIDGSDSYETRSLVAKACAELKIPLVSAAATQFDGQLAVFQPWHENRPCYNCLFPTPPRGNLSCAEVGIFSPLVGIVGTMAATEAMKLVLNLNVDDQKLTLIDSFNLSFTSLKARKNFNCTIC